VSSAAASNHRFSDYKIFSSLPDFIDYLYRLSSDVAIVKTYRARLSLQDDANSVALEELPPGGTFPVGLYGFRF
jgi:hypothetical protein